MPDDNKFCVKTKDDIYKGKEMILECLSSELFSIKVYMPHDNKFCEKTKYDIYKGRQMILEYLSSELFLIKVYPYKNIKEKGRQYTKIRKA